ncbi:MAG: hypothetical protein OEV92_12925 [Nitrospinota bacterium]|nr:hypothetical protein [Nitrospinota bacterium]
MRLNFLLTVLAAGALAASVSACGKKSVTTSSDTGSGGSSQSSSCVPVPEGSVKWTYEQCGPLTNGKYVDIRQTTTGDVPSGSGYTKEAISKHFPLNKGKMTFTISNLDWTDYPYPANDIIFVLFMAETETLRETNWHILGWRDALNGIIGMKLVAQRFDGMCIPYDFLPCERKSYEVDAPKFVRSKSYRFDCVWDTTADSGLYGDGVGDGYVQCDIYDVTTASSPAWIITHVVPTGGPFEQLNYVCVGGGCGPMVVKPSVPATLSNFRMTLFN